MAKFEVFTKRMVPLIKQPSVTIQKRGTISLNASAHALLGEPEAVELMYDSDSHIVGFRPVPATAEHAYPLRAVGGRQDGPFVVAGTAFTKYFKISTDISRRWTATLQDDVLCIDLNVKGTEVTSNRAGSGRSTSGS